MKLRGTAILECIYEDNSYRHDPDLFGDVRGRDSSDSQRQPLTSALQFFISVVEAVVPSPENCYILMSALHSISGRSVGNVTDRCWSTLNSLSRVWMGGSRILIWNIDRTIFKLSSIIKRYPRALPLDTVCTQRHIGLPSCLRYFRY